MKLSPAEMLRAYELAVESSVLEHNPTTEALKAKLYQEILNGLGSNDQIKFSAWEKAQLKQISSRSSDLRDDIARLATEQASSRLKNQAPKQTYNPLDLDELEHPQKWTDGEMTFGTTLTSSADLDELESRKEK